MATSAVVGSDMKLFGLLLVLFTIRDIISVVDPGNSINSTSPRDSEIKEDIDLDYLSSEWKAEKGGPGSKISAAKFSGPIVRILYCTSCGYQNAYDQYVQFIQEKYPEITVEGSSYPLPIFRRIAAQLLTIMKFLFLGAMLMNQWRIFSLLGLPARIISWMTENKVYASLLLFFVLNLLETQLASTGAFEMFIDDVPVWSKIQTGRLPNPPELVQIIDNHIKLGGNERPVFQLSS